MAGGISRAVVMFGVGLAAVSFTVGKGDLGNRSLTSRGLGSRGTSSWHFKGSGNVRAWRGDDNLGNRGFSNWGLSDWCF